MKVQKSFIFAVLLTIALVIVFFLQNNKYSDKKEYLKLFPTLNEKIDNISKIEVINSENSIHLLKKIMNGICLVIIIILWLRIKLIIFY